MGLKDDPSLAAGSRQVQGQRPGEFFLALKTWVNSAPDPLSPDSLDSGFLFLWQVASILYPGSIGRVNRKASI